MSGSVLTQDLWPETFDLSPKVITPATILRQQASLLGKKTKNIVEGEVETKVESARIYHRFYLRAPALDDYRFLLLEVIHLRAMLYPVAVVSHIAEDSERLTTGFMGTEYATEEDFVSRLQEILASDKTRQIIQSLISQSTTPDL